MVANIRTACDLGSQPDRFTAYLNESMNKKTKEMKNVIYQREEQSKLALGRARSFLATTIRNV